MAKVGGNELIVLNSMSDTSGGTQENIEWGEGHIILLVLKQRQVCTAGVPDYLQA